MAGIGPIPGIASVLGNAAAPGVSGAAGATAAASQAGPVGAASAPLSIGGPGDASSAGSSFLDAIGNALGQLNTQVNGADAAMAQFAAGGSADLHTVMLELQQASIGLKTGIAVRDKLLEAYQELMRIQL